MLEAVTAFCKLPTCLPDLVFLVGLVDFPRHLEPSSPHDLRLMPVGFLFPSDCDLNTKTAVVPNQCIKKLKSMDD